MKKIILKLHEVLALEFELIGINDIKGLLNLDIPFGVKFDLKKVLNVILENKTAFNQLNEDLFKKYGEKTETGYNILEKNKEEFIKKHEELLLKDIEFEYTPIKLSALYDVKTTDAYNIVYKLIEE